MRLVMLLSFTQVWHSLASITVFFINCFKQSSSGKWFLLIRNCKITTTKKNSFSQKPEQQWEGACGRGRGKVNLGKMVKWLIVRSEVKGVYGVRRMLTSHTGRAEGAQAGLNLETWHHSIRIPLPLFSICLSILYVIQAFEIFHNV